MGGYRSPKQGMRNVNAPELIGVLDRVVADLDRATAQQEYESQHSELSKSRVQIFDLGALLWLN